MPDRRLARIASPAADMAVAPDLAFPTATHALFPQLTRRGDGELSPLRLVTITAANEDPAVAAQLVAFGDAVVHGGWFGAWSGDYGIAAPSAHVHVVGAAVAAGTVMTTALLESYATDAIMAASPPPMPDGRTFYMVYLPAGAITTWHGQPNPDCTEPEAYHRAFGTGGDGIGVCERCPTYPTLSGDLDHFTVVGSHEIAEAAVDTGLGWALTLPAGADPWTASPSVEDEGNGSVENGDLCVGTRVAMDGFLWQRIYTNTAATSGGDPCMPPLPIPFYDTTTAQGWYEAAAGATVPIPVTGWSTGATGDWVVTSAPVSSSDASLKFQSRTTGTRTTVVDGKTYHVVNNGETVTVNVTVPAGAPSGAWVVVALYSFRFDGNGRRPPAGEDATHRWFVGVHVP